MKKDSNYLNILLTIFVGFIISFGLYLSSLYNYLLFHSLSEIISIVIAFSIFIVFWNTREYSENNYFLLMGIAYLFVGGLDLIHTLAYKGMNIFRGYDANLPTQFWIATRYLESFSFLIAPFFMKRKVKASYLFAFYFILFFILLASIFYWNIFPDCFVEGEGLTPFKKISEYIISIVLSLSVIVLIIKRIEFESNVFRLLVAAIITSIGAELAFTFYISVYGFSNLFGHFLKVISFYFIYKAIVETGLKEPYNLLFRDLVKSKDALIESEANWRSIAEKSPDNIIILDKELNIQFVNFVSPGLTVKELIGTPLYSYVSEKKQEEIKNILDRVLSTKNTAIYETEYYTPDGNTIYYESKAVPRIVSNRTEGLTVHARDITDRKRAEEERERLIGELKKALSKVKTLSGLLPICSNCKKIRDDKGYWQQIEQYIGEHSDADFTHGFCPDCVKELYPDHSKKKD